MRHLTLLALLLLSPVALSAVPSSIPYRGLLTHENGSPYEGEVTLEAALYPCFIFFRLNEGFLTISFSKNEVFPIRGFLKVKYLAKS